jgi:hypothetical protein
VEAEERIRTTPEGTDAAATEPVDERTAAAGDAPGALAHERCIHHPGRAAVARCAVCEEPICLTCAVPVRGRVLGPECLAVELGDPALIVPPEPVASFTGSWATIAGAVMALVATIGPWTRTGAGDRLLGAWVPSIRWSMVAAVAATILLPLAWWFRTRGSRSSGTLVALGGLVVVSASALAIAFPPTFQVASWGPWLGAAGGAISVAGAIVSGMMERRPRQGV